jgi:hypothetical protein
MKDGANQTYRKEKKISQGWKTEESCTFLGYCKDRRQV